jgi:hypothetical protein
MAIPDRGAGQMTDKQSPIKREVTAEELRQAAMHLVTAMHHIQTAIGETLPAIRHAEHGRHPHFGAIENSLKLSRDSLLEAFELLDDESNRSE